MKLFTILYLNESTNYCWRVWDDAFETQEEAMQVAREWKKNNPVTSSIMVLKTVADDIFMGNI